MESEYLELRREVTSLKGRVRRLERTAKFQAEQLDTLMDGVDVFAAAVQGALGSPVYELGSSGRKRGSKG